MPRPVRPVDVASIDEATREVRLHLQGALTVHAAAYELERGGWQLVRIDQRDTSASVYTLTLRPALPERRRPARRRRLAIA